jgi:hypothetical protein
MAVNLLPGFGFVQETTANVNMLPGFGFIQETGTGGVTPPVTTFKGPRQVMTIYMYTPQTTGVVATSVVFTPVSGTLFEPVPAGTKVGSVVVSPSNWLGTLAAASPFGMLGTDVVVAAGQTLLSGSYTLNGTALP